jgi:hypothetical protein
VESGESDAEEMNMKLKDHPTLFDMTPEVHAPTREEIAAACKGPGGFTKRRLASWGVGWPPPHGWRAKLEQAADERNAGFLLSLPVTITRGSGICTGGVNDEPVAQAQQDGERHSTRAQMGNTAALQAAAQKGTPDAGTAGKSDRAVAKSGESD